MADPVISDREDEALVREMIGGSDDSLAIILTKYTPRVKGYLHKQFGRVLQEADVNVALNQAVVNLWQNIQSYDSGKSTLLGWFIRIAHNAALDELRKERRQAAGELVAEPEFRPVKASERHEHVAETKAERRLRLMLRVITHELKGNRRVVAMADLQAGGTADRQELAARLGIPVTQVDVTRTQTRKRIRERVQQLELAANPRVGKS